ncbi:STAS domain-containing protein [Planctomycetota bacterium]
MDNNVSVEITQDGNAAVIAFKATSICNIEQITAASQQINNFVDENQPKVIVFDFKSVKFFSSQILGVLLAVRAKAETYKGKVVISAIEPQLHRVFRITNLDKIFEFFSDSKTAVSETGKN